MEVIDCDKIESAANAYVFKDGLLYGAFDNRLLWCSPQKKGTLYIPEKIKQVCACAFAGCEKLTEVYLPEGVEKIGDCAFMGAVSLKSVSLPSSVLHIGFNAFGDTNKSLSIHCEQDAFAHKFATENGLLVSNL